MTAERERGHVGAAVGPAGGLARDDELLRRYHQLREPAVREELVHRFLPFARSMALRYRGGSEPT